jgi:1-acyl-sn-glycerol-3-phosphate acyltransferase
MKYSPTGRAVSTVILRPLLSSLTKRDWRGQQNIPRQGGVIVAANHLSEVDPLALSHYVYKAGRYPVFLAKSTLFESRKVGWILRGCGQIPVYREGTDAGLALRDAEQALADGECLMFYPEGTCTRDPDLWPMTGKTGVARLALATGATVVPLAHWGSHEILPYRSRRFRLFPRRTMRVVAGPPIDLSKYTEVTPETLSAATGDIMRTIAGLLGELRGERPPDTLFDPKRKAQA